MRKISITLAAMTLIVASASCGNASSETSNTSSQFFSSPTEESIETTTGNEIVELDPFENVSITIPTEKCDYGILSSDLLVYPSRFNVNVECNNDDVAAIYAHNSYSLSITDADLSKVIVEVKIDDDVVSGLETEQNIKLVSAERNYEIDVTKCRMNYISSTQLTDECVDSIINVLKEKLVEEINEKENSSISGWNELAEDWNSGINNEENKMDVNSLIETDLEFVKCYADQVDDGLHFTSDDCTLTESIDNQIYVIFKNSNDNYFVVSVEPILKNGVLDSEETDYYTFGRYSPEDEFDFSYCFPSEKDAFDYIQSKLSQNKEISLIK